jgi:hypothetical protein
MKRRNNHTWLFAFSDLSFLLLISMTMIPSALPDMALHFAEMDLPLVPASGELSPFAASGELWELQVLGTTVETPSPFRLTRIDAQSGREVEGLSLDRQSLPAALERLRRENVRPVLLPEKSSLSHDLLFAGGALAQVWTDGRSPTMVRPLRGGE